MAPQDADSFLFTAGPALTSGAVQAILFNPIDRALYVRVKSRRKKFLDWRNFERPFQGFINAAVYRTLVGASYMFWQDTMRIVIEKSFPASIQANVSPKLNSVVIGLLAGASNGLALNTLQVVKFRMWNSNEKGVTFARTARVMYREGGWPIFLRGCATTMIRDCVFGVVYESVRRSNAWKTYFDRKVRGWLTENQTRVSAEDHHHAQGTEVVSRVHSPCGICAFTSNLVAAVLASVLSSPFNYVRSIVYGTPPGSIPLGYPSLLRSFKTQVLYIYRNGRSYTDSRNMPELSEAEHNVTRPRFHVVHNRSTRHHHPLAAWRWANSRLNIGWGSLRVGLGMAMSQSLFHFAQDFAHKKEGQWREKRQL